MTLLRNNLELYFQSFPKTLTLLIIVRGNKIYHHFVTEFCSLDLHTHSEQSIRTHTLMYTLNQSDNSFCFSWFICKQNHIINICRDIYFEIYRLVVSNIVILYGRINLNKCLFITDMGNYYKISMEEVETSNEILDHHQL